jgi:hypothetical protein
VELGSILPESLPRTSHQGGGWRRFSAFYPPRAGIIWIFKTIHRTWWQTCVSIPRTTAEHGFFAVRLCSSGWPTEILLPLHARGWMCVCVCVCVCVWQRCVEVRGQLAGVLYFLHHAQGPGDKLRSLSAVRGWPLSTEPSGYPLLLLLFSKDLFIYYMWVHRSCLQILQKRASDLIMDGCEPPCGYWDLNSGLLEEQSVLLTDKPSLQPLSPPFF